MSWFTSHTKSHIIIADKITKMGFQVATEIRFGPYTVDILIPEAYVGVEVDGKGFHISKKRDNKRDDRIMENYKLPILRIKVGEKDIEDKVLRFVTDWADSVENRKRFLFEGDMSERISETNRKDSEKSLDNK